MKLGFWWWHNLVWSWWVGSCGDIEDKILSILFCVLILLQGETYCEAALGHSQDIWEIQRFIAGYPSRQYPNYNENLVNRTQFSIVAGNSRFPFLFKSQGPSGTRTTLATPRHPHQKNGFWIEVLLLVICLLIKILLRMPNGRNVDQIFEPQL